jgi:hypothetical protein
MHESIAEQLSRFTPEPGGLDRDALLFAAGQASVRRPMQTWGVAVGALAACQLLTLFLLWPESKSPVGTVAKAPSAVNSSTSAVPAGVDEPTSIASLTRQTMQSPRGELPAGITVDHLAAADPPLRAFVASASVGLD